MSEGKGNRLIKWIKAIPGEMQGNIFWDFFKWICNSWGARMIALVTSAASGVFGWWAGHPIIAKFAIGVVVWLGWGALLFYWFKKHSHLKESPTYAPQSVKSPFLDGVDTGIIAIRSSPRPEPIVLPPRIPKTNAEVEREKEAKEKKERSQNNLADALRRLREQREETIRCGPDNYIWKDREDDFYRFAVEFAVGKVEECFGAAEAEYFRSDADLQRAPQDSHYAQVIFNLQQYEVRVKRLMDRLQ